VSLHESAKAHLSIVASSFFRFVLIYNCCVCCKNDHSTNRSIPERLWIFPKNLDKVPEESSGVGEIANYTIDHKNSLPGFHLSDDHKFANHEDRTLSFKLEDKFFLLSHLTTQELSALDGLRHSRRDKNCKEAR
jgi:hypothetical protein